MDTVLYKKIEHYVIGLFEDNSKPNLVFHNIDHTEYVVEKTDDIASHYQLTEKERLVLYIASWFHDTGYLFTEPGLHEQKSVEVMRTFLQENGVEQDVADLAAGCIMATKSPRIPNGVLQEIICDADTYNFGTKDFKSTNKKMFKEINFFNKDAIAKEQFNIGAYEMLRHHEFFTVYAQDQLNEGKKSNMKKLKKKEKKEIKLIDADSPREITEKEGTTKGMQTMLRLTSSNHIKLSDMADRKANILISVNSIIISVILSVLLRKLQTDTYLTIPTIIFLLVSVSTIVIAILATRPKVTVGTFSEEDILSKKTNLLFFGNFYKVNLDTYDKAMRTMLRDSDYLYSSIIKDIYFLGVVLGKKYRLLRLAYNIFMIGIIVSVLAFAIASAFNVPPPQEAVIHNASGSPF